MGFGARWLAVGSITAGLLAASMGVPGRAAAGPPKLTLDNNTVIIVAGVGIAALVTIGILTYDKAKEEQKAAAKAATKKTKPVEYVPKTKEQMKEELEKMRQEGSE